MFRTRLLEFLFPAETDHWLATLRIGIGVQVILYSMSLRNDWTFLLSGTVRRLAEALLSSESHFIPRLGWFVTLAAKVGVDENRLLFAAWACLLVAGCGLVIGFALPSVSDWRMVSSPLRGEERRICFLWHG